MTKYRIEKRRVPGVHADGTAITRTEEIRVPVLPRDWDQIAIRTVVALVLALTLVAVTWSTVSIGALLKGGVGYAAASIFDVAWAVCLILEWLARYEPQKRLFPRRLGWGLLVATMLAIGAHGALMMHSLAAAVIGGAVSLFAKVLWLGVLQHIDRDLSEDDQELVRVKKSTAYSTLALTSTRRQVAKVEQHAALELLAMEQAGYSFPAAPVVELVEPEPVRTAQTLDRAAEAVRTDSEHGTEASPRTVAALDAARADGWSVKEVWEAAMASKVASGHPVQPASAQMNGLIPAKTIHDGAAGSGDAGDERVPRQGGRLSLAAAVELLMVDAGLTDRDQLASMLPSMVGAPFKPESLDREMRKHRT
ncbi:hypothetical protein ACIBCA_36790 [Kitasatospora sp. NPDC051170]|uniref:hypothetical protein n=1 Tax=Kitasatospora sp. NPDC051170 TaxID=3364056 RepID=UPI0037A0330E